MYKNLAVAYQASYLEQAHTNVIVYKFLSSTCPFECYTHDKSGDNNGISNHQKLRLNFDF